MTETTIRVTTETVQKAIEQFVKDRGENRFTTADIARFIGVEEYPVRAAVSWLARYGMVEIIPGVRSRRYLGQPADISKRRHTDQYFASVYQVKERCGEADFAALMGVFCRG
jgi:hypothetical protein